MNCHFVQIVIPQAWGPASPRSLFAFPLGSRLKASCRGGPRLWVVWRAVQDERRHAPPRSGPARGRQPNLVPGLPGVALFGWRPSLRHDCASAGTAGQWHRLVDHVPSLASLSRPPHGRTDRVSSPPATALQNWAWLAHAGPESSGLSRAGPRLEDSLPRPGSLGRACGRAAAARRIFKALFHPPRAVVDWLVLGAPALPLSFPSLFLAGRSANGRPLGVVNPPSTAPSPLPKPATQQPGRRFFQPEADVVVSATHGPTPTREGPTVWFSWAWCAHTLVHSCATSCRGAGDASACGEARGM